MNPWSCEILLCCKFTIIVLSLAIRKLYTSCCHIKFLPNAGLLVVFDGRRAHVDVTCVSSMEPARMLLCEDENGSLWGCFTRRRGPLSGQRTLTGGCACVCAFSEHRCMAGASSATFRSPHLLSFPCTLQRIRNIRYYYYLYLHQLRYIQDVHETRIRLSNIGDS